MFHDTQLNSANISSVTIRTLKHRISLRINRRMHRNRRGATLIFTVFTLSFCSRSLRTALTLAFWRALELKCAAVPMRLPWLDAGRCITN